MKRKIEIMRNILDNAMKMHMSKEIILKISQQLDEYIVEYYRQSKDSNGDVDEEEYL